MPAVAADAWPRSRCRRLLDAVYHEQRQQWQRTGSCSGRSAPRGYRLAADGPWIPGTNLSSKSSRPARRSTTRRNSRACRPSPIRRHIASTPRSALGGSPCDVRRLRQRVKRAVEVEDHRPKRAAAYPKLDDSRADDPAPVDVQSSRGVVGAGDCGRVRRGDHSAAGRASGGQHVRQRAHKPGNPSTKRPSASRVPPVGCPDRPSPPGGGPGSRKPPIAAPTG